MKNKIQFMNLLYYRAFVCCLFALTVWRIVVLSRQVSFEDIKANKLKSVEIDIDICYPLDLINETYEIEENQEYKYVEKIEFDGTCNFEYPLAKYTKNFKEKKASEIISEFEKCMIENLAPVELSDETLKRQLSADVSYKLYFGKICVQHKHEFHMNSTKELTEIRIKSQDDIQTLDVYASFARNYENNEKYRSVKKHLVKRNCWLESNGERKCLESNKGLILDLIYFSIKSLKSPFVTDCTDRFNHSNQNDCYENCVKRTKNHYLLSYSKQDDVKLDYSDYKSMNNLSRKCSSECYQEDCKITAFYIDALSSVNETESDQLSLAKNNLEKDSNDTAEKNSTQMNRNSIVIVTRSTSFRTEALPLIEQMKIIWMIVVCFSVFFGFDVFGVLIKTTRLNKNTVNNDKKSSVKKVIFGLCIFLASLSLGAYFEKLAFNFGNLKSSGVHRTYYSEIESVRERNVSISVCYDPCMILKQNNKKKGNAKKCNNETLIKLTLEELEKLTWDASEFKKQVSLRNSVKIVPIRQDDFDIPVFYRLLKKCFLIQYHALNIYPHLALMRKSQIYLKFEPMEDSTDDRLYYQDHFYVEDGLEGYPKLESNYVNKSVLHKVLIEYRENDCDNHSPNIDNDLMEKYITEKYLQVYNGLPMFINIKMNNNYTLKEYLKKRFINESELNRSILEESKKMFKNRTYCKESKTFLTNQEIFTGDIGSISVNLTPFLFEKKFFERESILIVINRIISFFILFNCYSICDIIKGFVCTYLYSLASLYNFQFIKKLSYFLGFVLFCANSFFLFDSIVHSMSKTFSIELMKKIELPRFLICYEHQFRKAKTFKDNEESIFDEVTLYEDLDPYTLNFTDLIDQILVHQENDEEIDIRNRTKLPTTFYIDNMKCFGFNVDKVYDVINPNVPKMEILIEFHLNLKKLWKKRMRIFFFLATKNSLTLDVNKPFEPGMTTIYYLTKEYRIEDDYWCLKNLKICLNNFFGIEKFSNYPDNYLDELSKSFEKGQYSTTTSVLLYSQETKNDSRFNLPIRNHQFNSFIHFRSIDGKKNDFHFGDNRIFNDYSTVSYKKEKKLNDASSAKLFLRSNLIKIVSKYQNTYKILEFFLHFLVLLKFYFNFNFLFLPELYKAALPIMKFFVFMVLYCIVIVLLFLFECYFKFIRFLDFKYAY